MVLLTIRNFGIQSKPFLTNKDFLTDDNISIKVNDELVTDKTKLANLFNLHYINIVENTSGVPPVIQGIPNNGNHSTACITYYLQVLNFCSAYYYYFTLRNTPMKLRN